MPVSDPEGSSTPLPRQGTGRLSRMPVIFLGRHRASPSHGSTKLMKSPISAEGFGSRRARPSHWIDEGRSSVVPSKRSRRTAHVPTSRCASRRFTYRHVAEEGRGRQALTRGLAHLPSWYMSPRCCSPQPADFRTYRQKLAGLD